MKGAFNFEIWEYLIMANFQWCHVLLGSEERIVGSYSSTESYNSIPKWRPLSSNAEFILFIINIVIVINDIDAFHGAIFYKNMCSLLPFLIFWSPKVEDSDVGWSIANPNQWVLQLTPGWHLNLTWELRLKVKKVWVERLSCRLKDSIRAWKLMQFVI